MAFDKRLLAPRHWPLWFAMGCGWLLAQLPFPLQMWLGRRLGDIAYYVVPGRRRVAAINLRLCFPEWDDRAHRRVLRNHFRSVGMGAMETLICWWASDARIERLTDLEGLSNLEQAVNQDRGMLLLSAHFTSLELGVRMAQIYLKRLGLVTTAMYKAPHNPMVDHVMRSRREAHIGERSIPKDDVRGLARALRNKRAVWYAADQKATNKYSAVLPFFGNPAYTSLATGRLAAMGNAVIVPFFTLRRTDGRGYRLIVEPPLDHPEGGDGRDEAERLNAQIENVVRQAPEQYFWLHQRFKGPKLKNPYK